MGYDDKTTRRGLHALPRQRQLALTSRVAPSRRRVSFSFSSAVDSSLLCSSRTPCTEPTPPSTHNMPAANRGSGQEGHLTPWQMRQRIVTPSAPTILLPVPRDRRSTPWYAPPDKRTKHTYSTECSEKLDTCRHWVPREESHFKWPSSPNSSACSAPAPTISSDPRVLHS